MQTDLFSLLQLQDLDSKLWQRLVERLPVRSPVICLSAFVFQSLTGVKMKQDVC